jgi:hypothetical protein
MVVKPSKMLGTVYLSPKYFLVEHRLRGFRSGCPADIRDRRIEHANVNNRIILSGTRLSSQQCKAQIQAQE